MIQKFEVGKPFYLPNPAGINDNVVAAVTGESFDIICWAGGLNPKEIKEWRKGRLHYGVFIHDGIPFFLVDFPVAHWNFDISINILAEKEHGRDYQAFLDGKGNMVNFFLVDARTNILKAMRMIGIEDDIAASIKTACRAQIERYRTSANIGIQLNRLMAIYTTDAMIRATHMVQHVAR